MREGIDCKDKEWKEATISGHMKDASGKRFGRLVALFPVACNGKKQWLCQCDCGNELVAPYCVLSSGNTQSCGCVNRDKARQRWQQYREENNIVGQKFGRLTLIEFVGIENEDAIYKFACDCGNVTELPLKRVKYGTTNSCGCLWNEWSDSTKQDIIGVRFGKLVVQKYVGIDKRGNTLFECDCDCGNTTILPRYALVENKTHSCGCMVSVGESNIKKILNSAGIKYKPQYTFKDLKSDAGGHLMYDFGILDDDNQLQRLIEFDGPQHTQAYDYFGGKEKLIKQKYHDTLKNQYALSHNIPLVRISYDKRDSMILDDLLGSQYLIKEVN